MASPAENVELLAGQPSGTREDVLAVLRAGEAHRSWVAAREGKWTRYLDGLPKDPSSPAKNTAGEVGREQNVGTGQAKKRAERAEQLGQLPETESALEEGGITDAHADVMARARAKADAKARAALADHEARLLAHAATESPHEFQQRLERFVKNHSADDGRSAFEKKKAARRLSVWRDKDGMTQLRGTFDPISGQVIRTTLERVAEQLFRRDHQNHPADQPVPAEQRNNDQRNADALTEICKRADQVTGPAKNQDKAVVFLSHEDLLDRLNESGIASTLADGTPIPASVARRIACTAGIIPMVLNGDSLPLDEGRAQQHATRAQRTALRAQWATCSLTDCTIPFEWTEIHHIDPFHENGHEGPTDLINLTPGCDHCHDLAHTPGWTVEKFDNGMVRTTAPDGRVWERLPNGPAARHRSSEPPSAAATDTPPDTGEAATRFTEAA